MARQRPHPVRIRLHDGAHVPELRVHELVPERQRRGLARRERRDGAGVDDRAGRARRVDQHGLRRDGQAARPVQDRPARAGDGDPPGRRGRPRPDAVVDPRRERAVADRPGRGLRGLRQRRRRLHAHRDRLGHRGRRHEDHPDAVVLHAGRLRRRRGHRRLRAAGCAVRIGDRRDREPRGQRAEVREDRHHRR
ncbi:hypothetical protein BACI9J_200002 [Bacillus altitudinis]|nr:hypothetical protein BACI9J_200002 [Bacillus altitudinis]